MPNPFAQLADRWKDVPAAERANLQTYLREFCEALGVEPPGPSGSGHEFEYAVRLTERDGTETTNFIDCWKAGHFALEGKHFNAPESDDIRLRRAFGQVKTYVNALAERPPYIMVLDVGRTLLLWDRWSGDYGGFGLARRVDLRTLGDRGEDVEFLRRVWTDPAGLDPRAKAARVTREIAERLATLAASLEERGHDQEKVARFLIRIVFTMFAEDVGLLPEDCFRDLISDNPPSELPDALVDLWKIMDRGGRFGGRKIVRFNGHFFRDVEALPLTKADCNILTLAALADWQDVEPSIFGTLLVRALDPVERHRLGAEFTPPEYVERLVRPAVEEPIRERWTAVQAEALQLRETGKERDRKAALEAVVGFHRWLCGLQFLDPACGSGNSLYVTLHLVKRVELEVRQLENDIRKAGDADFRLFEVHPRQFHGLEIKPWAREIAELTLWIGYHQFWRAHQHVEFQPPILEDTGTIECRDAVLAWDDIRPDPTRDRPDPTPRIPSPVTGELVPDPTKKLAYMEYVNPRPAEWPRADFIVGNPPYLGVLRQRDALGDGYVEALRAAYDELPESLDYVMYWWHRGAAEVAAGRTLRCGLITTNTITQIQNRVIVADAAILGVRVVWAVADHPWVEEIGGAAVRVALTVTAKGQGSATLVEVSDDGVETARRQVPRLNADLTSHADVATAAGGSLLANEGLSSPGFKLHGAGFILEAEESNRVLAADARNREVVKKYRNGKDLTARPRGVFLIDFGLRTEEEARDFPVAFDIVRARVKPERDANKREVRARYWWRFGEPNPKLRSLLAGLARYIATVETSKHRFFVFLDDSVAPDNMLVCIGLEDAFHLGVLSSSVHVTWALAAGGRLGVGNDPRYNKTRCFDPFPFPGPPADLRQEIAALAERLDAHRKAALERDERVTMTGMYNVMEKLRTGERLTPKERAIHEIAACGVLRDLHDELDALVARAYGWPWPLEREAILERLVALHDERVEEERAGRIRWLRPDYQRPRFGAEAETEAELIREERPKPARKGAPEVVAWPAGAADQVAAVKAMLERIPQAPATIATRFKGARKELVVRHLDTLALLGEARMTANGEYAVS